MTVFDEEVTVFNQNCGLFQSKLTVFNQRDDNYERILTQFFSRKTRNYYWNLI